MAQRIYWTPPELYTPTRYEVHLVETPERFLTSIAHQVPGPYWEAPFRRFSVEDPQGTDTTVYRVRALGPNGELYGDSGPFQPSAAVAAGLASRTRVDHNFEDPDNLRYVTPSNQGIPDAIIRLFRASEWDQGRRDVSEYAVLTDANGRWKAPVWLEPGLDWVLIFEKAGEFGPDERRITV